MNNNIMQRISIGSDAKPVAYLKEKQYTVIMDCFTCSQASKIAMTKDDGALQVCFSRTALQLLDNSAEGALASISNFVLRTDKAK